MIGKIVMEKALPKNGRLRSFGGKVMMDKRKIKETLKEMRDARKT